MRLDEITRFDGRRGLALALDTRAEPAAELALASPAAVAVALAQGAAADDSEAARLACLGLALAAWQWRERPSDSRRGALIQAAETLRPALGARAAALLAAALARADAAVLAGDDALAAVLAPADAEARAADRAAERCGRHADGLLDDEETLLALPHSGRTLTWVLRLAAGQGRTLRLVLPAALAPTHGGRRVQRAAAELGLAVALADAPDAPMTVALAEAAQVGLDGTAILPTGALVAASHRGRAPLYVLAPEGPRDDEAAGGEPLPPELISAIVTSRGTYRPAMIGRFLDDRDAPPEVIPLT